MTKYGEVKDVQAETWACFYRYKVANDVRIAVMTPVKHIPSNITLAGHRALVSYEGQPMTCYRCHETGDFQQACPMRQRTSEIGHTATATTWADIAAQGTGGTRRSREAVDGETRRIHTVREEMKSEKKRGIHTKEQKTRYQGGQEQRHVSGREETDRSNNMKTATPPERGTGASSGESNGI